MAVVTMPSSTEPPYASSRPSIVRTAPARVGDFHQRNGDAGERDRQGYEERAVPPARRRRRARAAIGGRFAAKPEPAACEREGRDDRDRADHSARIVAGDVVERCVRHQIVGHDIDDVVRQHGGRGSRRNQQRRQRMGKRAHAALFGPPLCRASSLGGAWPSTARPSGRARRRARVYEEFRRRSSRRFSAASPGPRRPSPWRSGRCAQRACLRYCSESPESCWQAASPPPSPRVPTGCRKP